ncbi:MAG: hypothetical protein LBP37_04075 [Spirochaetaceae bacterium]|nr:hypothetical protein [Spirochaetaceae bacterium]
MNKKNGQVYCEDGVQYSPQEIILLYDTNTEIDIGVHLVKKIFAGEVIKVERDIQGDSQAKQIESGTSNSTPGDTNPGEKIPDTNGNGAGRRSGELDIY